MEDFDYKSFQAKVLEQLKSSKPLLDKDCAFAPLLENLLDAALEGEMDAINSVFPETIVQSCIVHLIRNSINMLPANIKRLF